MTHFWLTAWDWEPSIIVGCIGLLVGYAWAAEFKFTKRAWVYLAGVIILFLALVSPLDTLSDIYLFSAHMVQHMLLVLVVPPLLLLGIPRDMAQKAMRYGWVRRAEVFLSKPILAWSAGVGVLWIWHWPPFYNAALANEQIHIMEHLCFLVCSTIFWWPVISPIEELRLEPLKAVVYTFGACFAHTILGIILTFAPVGHYTAYINPPDPYGILPIIRDGWGISAQEDQQWGGLIMWVPACLVYLTFILATLARWYRTPEQEEVPAESSAAVPILQPVVVTSAEGSKKEAEPVIS